jgi:head-tail adaptor
MEKIEGDMSLLSDAMEKCVIINRLRVNDGYGGYKNEWVDGAEFQAAITLDSSTQAKLAEASGVTALYTIITGREMNLQYHDVLRRESDGKIFRVTSDGDDKKTPKSAGLDMRNVSAEEWRLTE